MELSVFVGRSREIEEIRRLLRESRLLTLTGAGGSGKTRLALEVVSGLDPDRWGPVGWASLAALEDPEHIVRQIAGAFGIGEEIRGGAPGLATLLGGGPRLLVLDNCEHLVEPAASVAATLLTGCADLKILGTSREALGIGGEQAWLVPPLTLPRGDASPADLVESEAVQLFLQRGRDAVAGFSVPSDQLPVVADICRKLDGIPLAIELAAARVRVLSLEQIRDRLDDALRLLTHGGRTAPSRHRTLQATIDWSHDLLPPDARILFRRLAAFRGGFTLEAVEAVGAGGDLEADRVLDVLSTLVDRSLVLVREEGGAARYDLLETVRQYARRRLSESDEEEGVRDRHAAFTLRRVAAEEPHFTTPERRASIARLLPDLENIREALHWTRDRSPTSHAQLVGMLWWFWYSTALWAEARGWIEGALSHPEVAESHRSRASLLFAHGALSALQARPVAARASLEQAAALARTSGDDRLFAYTSNYIGLTWASEGRPEGMAHLQFAESWFREQNDLYGLRLSLLLLGSTAAGAGDLDAAERLNREGVAIARVFGIDRELAVALQNLAGVHLRRRDAAGAEPLLREALACLRRDPSYFFMAVGLDYMAEVLSLQGDHARAARVLGVADGVRSLIAAAPFGGDRGRREAMILTLGEALGEEALQRIRVQGRSLAPEVIIDELLAVVPDVSDDPSRGAGTNEAPHPAPHPAVSGDLSGSGAWASAPPLPEAAPLLVVRAMGPLEIEVDGRRLDAEAWPYGRPRELLLLLVSRPGGATREQIGEALWPDSTPARIRNSLHVTLHHLRRTLQHPDWVVLSGGHLALHPDLGVDSDVGRLDCLLKAHGHAVVSGEALPRRCARLEEARALCRGDFLEGEVGGAWMAEERDRVRRLQVEAALALAQVYLDMRDPVRAVDLYRWVLLREELNEDVHRRLMEALVLTGDRSRAIRHYHTVVELLRHHFDAEPETATTALHDRIRTGSWAEGAPA